MPCHSIVIESEERLPITTDGQWVSLMLLKWRTTAHDDRQQNDCQTQEMGRPFMLQLLRVIVTDVLIRGWERVEEAGNVIATRGG